MPTPIQYRRRWLLKKLLELKQIRELENRLGLSGTLDEKIEELRLQIDSNS